ncbi:MAG: sulfotransferase family protein [Rhodobacteraceae bacterium]|nr:sulfotransferase family protein [Paracoccaceae bacterium]
MIISRGRGYVFVHIPKTGGTSMALALEARAKSDDILIGDTPKAKRRKARLAALTPRGRLWKHSTLADIDGILTPAELSEMFVFTLVRNPWDRMVSYYHWLQDQSFDHPAVALSHRLHFAEFVAHPMIQASFLNAPYASYVTDVAGSECCALFLRLEHLDDDLDRLTEHLGFQLDLPHVNRSDRRTYREYYTEAGKLQVAQMCASDIQRFNYLF